MQKQSAQRQTRRNPAKISKVAVLRFSALQSSVTGFGISGSQGLSFLVLLFLLLLFFFFTPSLVNTFAPLKQYKTCSDSLVTRLFGSSPTHSIQFGSAIQTSLRKNTAKNALLLTVVQWRNDHILNAAAAMTRRVRSNPLKPPVIYSPSRPEGETVK